MPVVIKIFLILLYTVLFALSVILASEIILYVLDKLYILDKISGNPFLEFLCGFFVVVSSITGITFFIILCDKWIWKDI